MPKTLPGQTPARGTLLADTRPTRDKRPERGTSLSDPGKAQKTRRRVLLKRARQRDMGDR